MKIVLFLLFITYIYTNGATTATLDLKEGQSLTVGTAGTVTIAVVANGDMSLKSITGLVLQKTDDTSKTIALTCSFDNVVTFSDSDATKEVTCSTAEPEIAGSYKLAEVSSGSIVGNDGSSDISTVTFSVVTESKTLSITAKVEVDPCDGKAEAACTGTCRWNSATSKCVTAEVEVDPCDGKAEAACTGTCSWNSATSKCVTAGSGTGEGSGSGTNEGSGSGTNEGSGSDSSGFLKLSAFICLFVLFL